VDNPYDLHSWSKHYRETERRHLGRDLHDGLGPTLAGLALELNAARKLIERNKPQEAEVVLARLERQTEDSVEKGVNSR
jgi:signal transduction histidine kinase